MKVSQRSLSVRIAIVAFAACLLFIASDGELYGMTDPVRMHVAQVILRKLESIAAFAVLGGIVSRSWRRGAPSVAAFSCCIEIAQHFSGSRESLAWNAVDVACGFFGGALGSTLAGAFVRLTRKRASSHVDGG